MTGTALPGLAGGTPAGFLAALGVLAAYDGEPAQPKMSWEFGRYRIHPVIHGAGGIADIAAQAQKAVVGLLSSAAMQYRPEHGAKAKDGKIGTLKFEDDRDTRAFLDPAQGVSARLASCLTAEGAYYLKKGKRTSKPTAWDFTGGQQQFAKKIRDEVLDECDTARLTAAMENRWHTEKTGQKSLRWELSADRTGALSAKPPADEEKRRNIGAEALAVLGLTFYPVFACYPPGAAHGEALTAGFRGRSPETYTWPLWTPPSSPAAVRDLLAAVSESPERQAGLGIARVMTAPVDRKSIGKGYGIFRPPSQQTPQEPAAGAPVGG